MRVLSVIVLLILVGYSASASHIVGGEFEILHLAGTSYRINLILYFDEKFGNPGAKDGFADIRIFRKRDHLIMINGLRLVRTSETNVEYTQPECSDGEIITSKIIYTNTIELTPEQFSDPFGYYISWERCCRNYQIANIFSDPPGSGSSAGQTFYLEFPPVVKDGEPFINSSPRLFPPLNDYACPNKKYYVDFAGTDDDGDSLVYSLVTPLNTWTIDALPPGGLPRPGPYPNVTWRPGYGVNNVLKGNPDLTISDDGFLTVTPPLVGQALYVFAVKCEEYRDGVKIGEVRRDFQMLVVDKCPVASPPQIVGRKKGTLNFSQPNETLSVSFSNAVTDENRCVNVRVSDLDSEKADDDFEEKIRIRVLPLNFKHTTRYLNDLLPTVSNATLTNGSTVDFTICFPQCSYVPDGNYQVGIIAYDDACSLPLSDTLRINVFVEPPVNNNPIFLTPNQTVNINEGDPLISIPFEATDIDLDKLTLSFITNGFVLSNVGMTLTTNSVVPGQASGVFTWDSRCDVFDFTQKTKFNLKVFVEDQDFCLRTNRDTLIFNLDIKLPGNSDPIISSDLQVAGEKYIEVEKKIYESLQFNVMGTDADNDFLELNIHGIGFDPAAYGMIFPGDEGNGVVTSPYEWNLNCDKINLDNRDVFEMHFIVVDNANKCRFYKADTLVVVVNVSPPDNSPPTLTLESLNPEQSIVDGSMTAILGSEISLKLTGADADLLPKDNIQVSLVGTSGNLPPAGYTFTPAKGLGSATAYFTWNPDCSIFQDGLYENDYVFTFSVTDSRCFNPGEEIQELKLKVQDVDGSDDEFLPPNIITPDGNGKNEYFAMVELIPPDLYESILPKDNCLGSFVNIRIYDRWGTQVFESSNRDFKWFADGSASGVYFYFLTYTHRQYKGTVSVKF